MQSVMRVYHYVLLASCVCMMSAQAATIVAELPESQSVSQTATMARTSGQELLDKVKGLQMEYMPAAITTVLGIGR